MIRALSFLCLALSLSACGSDSEPGSADAPAPSAPPELQRAREAATKALKTLKGESSEQGLEEQIKKLEVAARVANRSAEGGVFDDAIERYDKLLVEVKEVRKLAAKRRVAADARASVLKKKQRLPTHDKFIRARLGIHSAEKAVEKAEKLFEDGKFSESLDAWVAVEVDFDSALTRAEKLLAEQKDLSRRAKLAVNSDFRDQRAGEKNWAWTGDFIATREGAQMDSTSLSSLTSQFLIGGDFMIDVAAAFGEAEAKLSGEVALEICGQKIRITSNPGEIDFSASLRRYGDRLEYMRDDQIAEYSIEPKYLVNPTRLLMVWRDRTSHIRKITVRSESIDHSKPKSEPLDLKIAEFAEEAWSAVRNESSGQGFGAPLLKLATLSKVAKRRARLGEKAIAEKAYRELLAQATALSALAEKRAAALEVSKSLDAKLAEIGEADLNMRRLLRLHVHEPLITVAKESFDQGQFDEAREQWLVADERYVSVLERFRAIQSDKLVIDTQFQDQEEGLEWFAWKGGFKASKDGAHMGRANSSLTTRFKIKGDFSVELVASLGRAKFSNTGNMYFTVCGHRFKNAPGAKAMNLRASIKRVGNKLEYTRGAGIVKYEIPPEKADEGTTFHFYWRSRTSHLKSLKIHADAVEFPPPATD